MTTRHPTMGRPLALALFGLLLLAGCTGSGGTIYHRSIESTSLSQAVQHLRGSQVTLVVRGNPFGGDQAEFEQFVADAIYGANPGTDATFVPKAAEAAQGGRRIILVLNGPVGSNGYVMCGGPPPAGGEFEPGGHVRALAAFCGGDDRPLSFVSAGLSGNQGRDDPAFRNFLRQVILALLPMQNPDDRPDHDREWPLP
jgi:hypothetical protein